jgi:DNA-binding response OmpR family regulator
MAKAKILMVDDNPDILELMAARLVSDGYEVITATSGEEAVRKAASERPDLALLDIAMPVIDGFILGRLLRLDYATQDIPVIMVTARSSQKDILRALSEIHAADYIVKPFKPEELLAKIKKVLEKRNENG